MADSRMKRQRGTSHGNNGERDEEDGFDEHHYARSGSRVVEVQSVFKKTRLERKYR